MWNGQKLFQLSSSCFKYELTVILATFDFYSKKKTCYVISEGVVNDFFEKNFAENCFKMGNSVWQLAPLILNHGPYF